MGRKTNWRGGTIRTLGANAFMEITGASQTHYASGFGTSQKVALER